MIVEMKKIHSLALLMLLLATLLTSCNSSSFKIDGELANVKGATVRVVFRGDSGIVDESATVDKKGKFTFKGEASSPVLVSILDQRGELLKKVVAVNGDHLKLKGDAGKSMGIKAKGSRVNEDWQLFIDEHLAFYTDPNPSRLDAAIELYKNAKVAPKMPPSRNMCEKIRRTCYRRYCWQQTTVISVTIPRWTSYSRALKPRHVPSRWQRRCSTFKLDPRQPICRD